MPLSLRRNFLSFCRSATKKAAISYTYESNVQGAEQDEDEDEDEESSDEEIDLGCDVFMYQWINASLREMRLCE